jgi:hypothetical protein
MRRFRAGSVRLERDEFQLFDQPIPYRGARGIFHVPDDLIPLARGGGREYRYPRYSR